MHGNLSVDIITSSKTVFLKLHSWKNVCLISQQIMSTDKYLCIFSCQMEIVVYKASIWPQTYACLFVLEYFLFLEAHSLPQAPLSEIIKYYCSLLRGDNFHGQISAHISTPNGGHCLFTPSNQ